MAGEPIRRRAGMAMGQGNLGYGHFSQATGGKSMSKHVPTAGHHNMDGHIGRSARGHTHKSHGHNDGVHHKTTGGVGHGGASTGKSQSASKGPSDTPFGSGMPKGNGSSLGRW